MNVLLTTYRKKVADLWRSAFFKLRQLHKSAHIGFDSSCTGKSDHKHSFYEGLDFQSTAHQALNEQGHFSFLGKKSGMEAFCLDRVLF